MDGNAEKRTVFVLRGRLVGVPKTDKTLTKAGYAADAKATGARLKEIQQQVRDTDPHYAENVMYAGTIQAENVKGALEKLHSQLDQYVPKTGGKMSAKSFQVLRLENEIGNACYIDFYGQGAHTGRIGMNTNGELCFFTLPGNVLHAIFHSGNKPSGSYIGTGQSVEVDIGGIGGALLITGNNYTSIVTAHGSITIKSDADGVEHLKSSDVSFSNGQLTIKTGHDGINAKGEAYTYQVL